MKFTIDQSALATGLARVQSAISSRPTVPVLANILLSVKGDELILNATDLDLSLTTTLPCSAEREGTTTLPAKKLLQIVRQLPNAPVTIDTDENHVSAISCQSSYFKILGMSDAEFPLEKELDDVRSFTLKNEQFRKTFEKISYSVSTDETRLVLNGILLSIRDGAMTAVATDGRRLALMETILDCDDLIDGDTILPSKAVSEVQKLLSVEGDVSISLGNARAVFATGNTVLRTKLVEGNYPNYRQVIPSGFSEEISIPREDLAKALTRVSLVLNDNSSSVKMDMKADMVVVSANSNTDESSEPVMVDYPGTPISISFNPHFIQEPLKYLDCNNVSLRFNDKISPIGVFGDEGFLYVIMPMRN